ncbi:esterase family protein [Bacteroides sp. K03]|uniref:alpha/beta hydrolase n=1 Tax=Bacteroides TaxID=816 RepID=UPI001C8CC56A|nr:MULTISPECIES: alpha/beta hydrolase family protein [Bacteroides]MBX9189996.1 esterase family protein [Bacteroides sp. K03]
MVLKSLLLLICLWICIPINSSVVDTIKVKSEKMNRDIPCIVIAPDTKKAESRFPVLYLLHGYSNKGYHDSHKVWIDKIKSDLPILADQYGIMIVCPNAENSWYWDSLEEPKSQFETFITKELVEYIDENYVTVSDRRGRAITGASMGGHGALWLAIRHQDIFGAAGSMSGGVDITLFPDKWEIKKHLGEQSSSKQIWEHYTVINQIDKLKNGSLCLIIDCGYNDFFFQVNNNLHQKLLKQKIAHDYIVRPGGHTFQYWSNSIDYQLLFFSNFFKNISEVNLP